MSGADQAADTNIEGEGCRQCDKLEADLEREHRRYIDASRKADDCRKERDLLRDALKKVYGALMRDPPHGPQKHVGPDDVIYCLDGQLMYHAINVARDALALVRASMRESSINTDAGTPQ